MGTAMHVETPEVDPDDVQPFDEVVKGMMAQIDVIKSHEQRDPELKKKHIQGLVDFVDENSTMLWDGDSTVLHQFLRDINRADDCPVEVLNAILETAPYTILMNCGGDIPLLEFIKRHSRKMVRVIIEFMAQDMKERNLSSLTKAAYDAAVLWDETEQHLDVMEPGRDIIRAAFNFYERPNELLPVDIDLLETLVKLAAPEMLHNTSRNELGPLEQALRFDLSISNPVSQKEIMRLILDKCPDSIHDFVTEGVKFRARKANNDIPQHEYSLYRWHVATKDQWLRQYHGQSSVSTPTKLDTSGQLAGSNISSEARPEGTQSKNEQAGKDDLLVSPSQNTASIPNTHAVKLGKPIMSKHSRSPSNIVGLGAKQPPFRDGRGKEGQIPRRPPPNRRGPSNRPKPNEIRATQQDIDIAEKASDEICRELGVRFLRSTVFHDSERRTTFREIDTEIRLFFGDSKRHYYFAMDKAKEYRDMTEAQVRSYFGKRNHYHTLRHVFLQPATILLQNDQKRPASSLRYTDHLQFFRWFRDWGVRKILKVEVHDGDHPHRDEEIEEALAGIVRGKKLHKSFDVEVLDWHKEDLCPQVIQVATPMVREIHLRWSGRNSVLRGWSEPEGLPALEYLEKVYIYYKAPSAEEERIRNNIKTFSKRIQSSRGRLTKMEGTHEDPIGTQALLQTQLVRRPTMTLAQEQVKDAKGPPIIQVVDMVGSATTGAPGSEHTSGSSSESVEQPWFKYVEEFVSMIPPPERLEDYNLKNKRLRRVRVALIDDGVDLFSKGMRSLESRVLDLEGRSFDETPDGPNPVFSSVSGHGTFMAKSILRICPFADIIPYRLKTVPDATTNRRLPDASSAAKAIKAAIEQDVDIISMSWTIRNDNNKIPEETLAELRNCVSKAEGLNPRIPIMFCAASDDGNQTRTPHGKGEFPRDMNNANVFCIGAADPHGQVWPQVTDGTGLNFLFPGVDIRDVFEDDTDAGGNVSATGSQISDLVGRNGRTGSSVATALAAGLAALLIHCTKLGYYYTIKSKGPEAQRLETITDRFVDDIATFEGMHSALDNLSSGSRSGTKFANPSKEFASAIRGLRKYDIHGGAENNLPEALRPIATLCRNLCRAAV